MFEYKGRSLLDRDYLSTAWTEAVYNADNDMVWDLLNRGMSADQPLDRRGVAPLNSISDISTPNGHQLSHHGETVRMLIRKGASLHSRDVTGFMPAHIALFSGNPDVAKEIVLATLREEVAKGMTPPLRPMIREFFSITYAEAKDAAYANLERNLRAIAAAVSNDRNLREMAAEDRRFWTNPSIPACQELPEAPKALRDQFTKVCLVFRDACGGNIMTCDPASNALLDAELDRLRCMQRAHIQALKP